MLPSCCDGHSCNLGKPRPLHRYREALSFGLVFSWPENWPTHWKENGRAKEEWRRVEAVGRWGEVGPSGTVWMKGLDVGPTWVLRPGKNSSPICSVAPLACTSHLGYADGLKMWIWSFPFPRVFHILLKSIFGLPLFLRLNSWMWSACKVFSGVAFSTPELSSCFPREIFLDLLTYKYPFSTGLCSAIFLSSVALVTLGILNLFLWLFDK